MGFWFFSVFLESGSEAQTWGQSEPKRVRASRNRKQKTQPIIIRSIWHLPLNIWRSPSLEDFLELDFLPTSLGFWDPLLWLLLHFLSLQQGPPSQQCLPQCSGSCYVPKERVQAWALALVAPLQGCYEEWIEELFKTQNIKVLSTIRSTEQALKSR